MVKKWPFLEDQLDRKADDGANIQFWWSVRKNTKPTLLSWFPLRPNDPQLKLFADQQYRTTHKRAYIQFSGGGGGCQTQFWFLLNMYILLLLDWQHIVLYFSMSFVLLSQQGQRKAISVRWILGRSVGLKQGKFESKMQPPHNFESKIQIYVWCLSVGPLCVPNHKSFWEAKDPLLRWFFENWQGRHTNLYPISFSAYYLPNLYHNKPN